MNAISPGSIDTPGLSDLLASSETGEERKRMIEKLTPLGRLGRPDEIANAVVFLACDFGTRGSDSTARSDRYWETRKGLLFPVCWLNRK